MSKKIESLPPLEASVQRALQALDNQVAREMQRSPSERELHGVQKWEPYNRRVEQLAGFVTEQLGCRSVELDGVLILAQALSKSLSIFADELGAEGLGSMRSQYVSQAGENIASDARKISALVGKDIYM
jgi:hypothetical protein